MQVLVFTHRNEYKEGHEVQTLISPGRLFYAHVAQVSAHLVHFFGFEPLLVYP